ncbi:unnamed protein product [Moneuplotes crassus]|uniref:Uncharacterized protein n=1 Tax=Euplotes crassus TaxID=5936 RepID=A0AAD2D6K5_EUPCR|nr:unnamed protein product [Moneuplotes crassus]
MTDPHPFTPQLLALSKDTSSYSSLDLLFAGFQFYQNSTELQSLFSQKSNSKPAYHPSDPFLAKPGSMPEGRPSTGPEHDQAREGEVQNNTEIKEQHSEKLQSEKKTPSSKLNSDRKDFKQGIEDEVKEEAKLNPEVLEDNSHASKEDSSNLESISNFCKAEMSKDSWKSDFQWNDKI